MSYLTVLEGRILQFESGDGLLGFFLLFTERLVAVRQDLVESGQVFYLGLELSPGGVGSLSLRLARAASLPGPDLRDLLEQFRLVRQQLVSLLQRQSECPVCYEKFSRTSEVHQCQEGHFVCGVWPARSSGGLPNLQGEDDGKSSRVRGAPAKTRHLINNINLEF